MGEISRHIPQTTLSEQITLSGRGVHSGTEVSLTLYPADAGTGYQFIRTGLKNGRESAVIQASAASVCRTDHSTVLDDGAGVTISTVEHVLSALYGLGVDNALVEIDGAEMPIMDGSSRLFAEAIGEAGIRALGAPRRFIKVVSPLRIDDGGSFAEFRPYDGFRVDAEIDYDTALIGRQRYILDVTPETYAREIASARTYGFMADVEQLWAAGLALGASFENTIVLGDEKILNQEGLRFSDEFVRHKALDACGDLALLGAPLIGAYHSVRGGHRLNVMAVKALMANADAWTWVEAPRRRPVGHGQPELGVSASFGPSVS